jgi:hypothetical protein
MRKTYDEQPDLDLVSAYLADRGLSTERFSRTETQAGKTPDFRVRRLEKCWLIAKSSLPTIPGSTIFLKMLLR